MIYTIYDPITGQIQSTITGSSASDLALNLQGKTYIEGNFDDKHYYIVDGAAVPKAADPSNSLMKYSFDHNSKQWVINLAATERLARNYRNVLLGLVDKINPVWWAALTTEQQVEVSDFRSALLAVPQQAGFPSNIQWPDKPTFL
jgi:hypothetical protein